MNEACIVKALKIAADFGGIEGDHHRAWVIDQMVRALTACPITVKTAYSRGKPYTYEVFGESGFYLKFVAMTRAGESGPETYEWDEGIAP